MLQPVALGVIAASLVAWWAHGRHRQRLWGYVAALGWAIAGVLLLFSLSPYHPVARLSVDQSVYQLATYHEARTPDLFLLFACDPTGLVCRQVSAYAPFDVGSGRAVTGTPTLVTDASTGAILVRIDSYTIGVYTPGK
jgi:hypothetical protein